MTVSECAKLLTAKDNILLVTHKNPDGDTVMSSAALCRALRRKGKKAFLYPNPQITKKMLPFVEGLFAPEKVDTAFTVTVDVAGENLFPQGFEGKVDLAIDHHPSNTHFAEMELIDAQRSSCGEIVQKLIKALNGKLSKNEATLLFVALTTDTGAFQYANVDEHSFRSAAELLHAGADHHAVMLHFFRRTSMARLRLEGMIYSGLHMYRDGKVVVSTVTQQMLRAAEATEDDCDDLAGLSGRAENAVINVLIRELADGSSKISVRSGPGYSSQQICSAFGGGGHELAAGCTIPVQPDRAEAMLLDVIEALYGEQL